MDETQKVGYTSVDWPLTEMDETQKVGYTSVDWPLTEMDETQKVGYASSYDGKYVHNVRKYPELAEYPFNICFVKKSVISATTQDSAGRHGGGREQPKHMTRIASVKLRVFMLAGVAWV